MCLEDEGETGESGGTSFRRRIGTLIREKFQRTSMKLIEKSEELESLRERGVTTPYLALTFLMGKIAFVVALLYFTATGILADQGKKVNQSHHNQSLLIPNILINHVPIQPFRDS